MSLHFSVVVWAVHHNKKLLLLQHADDITSEDRHISS